MALGYEMGAILRRSSQVFRDETIAVKIDTFEQLQREYVNVSCWSVNFSMLFLCFIECVNASINMSDSIPDRHLSSYNLFRVQGCVRLSAEEIGRSWSGRSWSGRQGRAMVVQ